MDSKLNAFFIYKKMFPADLGKLFPADPGKLFPADLADLRRGFSPMFLSGRPVGALALKLSRRRAKHRNLFCENLRDLRDTFCGIFLYYTF
jgi:hypothetical protein